MSLIPPLFWTVAVTAVLLAGGAAYVMWRNAAFEAEIARDVSQVDKATAATSARPELPKIVSAYALRAGGRPGRVRAIRLEHRAELTVDRTRGPIAIHAEQWLSPGTSAMAWVGRGSMAGLPVTVIDRFVKGTGLLEARLLGTFTVAGGRGRDFDKGELQRYLSELPVHPDAILSNGALSWEQIDERTVEVTGQSSTGPASARFTFDAAGDIVGMVANRPMSTNGDTIPTVWQGSYSDFRENGGYRIPMHGEVGWQLADGFFTYWRGDIIAYDTQQ